MAVSVATLKTRRTYLNLKVRERVETEGQDLTVTRGGKAEETVVLVLDLEIINENQLLDLQIS